jgi:rhomboid protease GluP
VPENEQKVPFRHSRFYHPESRPRMMAAHTKAIVMPAQSSFGKRGTTSAPSLARIPSPRSQAPAIQSEAEDDQGALAVLHASNIPALTIGLIVLLCVIFGIEVQHSSGGLSPTTRALVAMGGVDAKLVFGAGQWWRIFTAPLLHLSVSHLVGNCIALFFAGLYLEPLIGGAWFIALFVLAALGGSLGSMAQSDPNIVSVGASGAIMGLLAMSFLLSGRVDDKKRRLRMQILSARIAIPAVAPAFLPLLSKSGLPDHIDYGAHLGGLLTGIMVWLLLSIFWPREAKSPPFRTGAGLLAAGGAVVATCAFLLNFAYAVPQAQAEPVLLIPSDQFPRDTEDAVQRSADLVTRFPDDPRAHLLRAYHFIELRDYADASDQLQTGIAALPRHAGELKPEVEYQLKMTLALLLANSGDPNSAREMAAQACSADETKDWKLRSTLVDKHICP